MKYINHFLFVALVASISSCGGKETGQMGQIPQYPAIKLQRAQTTLEKKYPATIEGREDIEIRPKVEGYLEKIYVDEGAVVKKGDLLFKINAPQYQQSVISAESAVKNAQIHVDKTRPLVEDDIVNPYELEAAILDLKAKKADLVQARTNLGYTMIKSPIDGVVGKIPFRTGSLVSPQVQNPLTVVSDIAQVHIYFSLDENEFLSLYNSYQGSTLDEKLKHFPKVHFNLSNGQRIAAEGVITSISGLLDQQTGTARIRATFPNKDHSLRSGGSGTIVLGQTMPDALLVPQKSTFELQDKRMVYKVVDNHVVSTEIQVMSMATNEDFVVTQGLSPGDVVVYEGAGTLREDMEIQPQLIQ
ncbi:efflux RND transporter periplasmic adaptor subunit [Flagellimonas oceanensis]|uniref:efflux RND transporter periplasmic adaptor subunit n=1 Tax=Flagellimonas oceanensis TaxID=2499163 RepID=UPI000F8F81CB|nr:efflux RND transporter periplasmic adaptor subunit [Allomuricauda oceanensis]